MSKAPTSLRPVAEPVMPEWFRANVDPPLRQIVLVTCEPHSDSEGIPARWYERRSFIAGRWLRKASWVDPATLVTLNPQPTHWRQDPARLLLEPQK